jgi:hypothetical protein
VESRIGPFGDGVSVGVRCTVCTKLTIGSNSFWRHPIVLLGDEAQMEAHFGPFADSANLEIRYMHGLRQTFHSIINCFWMHPMVLLGDEAQVKARFSLFGDSANLYTI